MNFRSILDQSIDEKALAENVFIPILESTAEKLPFVSVESRIAIEDYILDIINKDLLQIKLDFDILCNAHSKVLKEVDAEESENFANTLNEPTMSISKINSLLKLKTPKVSKDMKLRNSKYTLGEKTINISKILESLILTLESIDSAYKGANGHLTDAMSKEGRSKGYKNIKTQLSSVAENLDIFGNKLKESLEANIEKGEKGKDVIKDIWTNLLIDAISLLKMNDTREKIYVEREIVEKKDDLLDIFEVFNMTRRASSYGIEELVEYFKDFIDYESVLYGMNRHYRDHKKHVLQVWALGISLIHQMHSSESNIHLNDGYETKDIEFQFTPSSRKNEKLIVKSELWAMWTIIALCHDLGYPIEKTSQINKQAKKIISHFGSMQFTELDYNFSLLNTYLIKKFLNIISSRVDNEKEASIYETTVQEKYKDKLSKSLEDYKHGIFSSLLLYKNLTYFLETDYSSVGKSKPLSKEDARQFYIRKEILRSIAGHTCPKLYHIRLDTLAFLLILCDELQEWNRPKAENLLFLAKEEVPDVKIDEFIINNKYEQERRAEKEFNKDEEQLIYDSIKISMSYNILSTNDLKKYLVIYRFKNMHYLLRSGKDDDDRKFRFQWEIKFKDKKFVLKYDSAAVSYEQLTIKEFIYNPESIKDISLYDLEP